MSWSQIKAQATEAARRRLVDQITAWRTVRDPFLDPKSTSKLQLEFQQRAAAIARASGQPHGIQLRQLEAAHGQIKGLEPSHYQMPDGTFVEKVGWDKMTGDERKTLYAAAKERKAARDGDS